VKLGAIRLVVCDVDGVLTDGRLYYTAGGENLKAFSVRDGLGIKRLQAAGVIVAVISGRLSPPLEARLADLGIVNHVLDCRDKGAAFDQLRARLKIDAAETLAIGDDVIDLPMLERAGIGVAVADAHPEVLRRADLRTRAVGGAGAVREIADLVLAAAEPEFAVVIPSRYGSTRLPGKPLAEIAGRPMIAHVWDRAVESGASEIAVATDDARIAAAVRDFGGDAVMTSPEHASGTDRIAEVAAARGWPADAIVVNLQGDEPALPGEHIREVARALARNAADIATLAAPITEPARLFDPSCVKVVIARSGHARLFSRAPIPWVRDRFVPGQIPESLPDGVTFLRHIGLYAYRVAVLERLTRSPPAAIEQAESLEQLRALDLGLDIHVSVVTQAPPDGVDTENDLARIERYLTS
jgi:3-deoxy-manno-octulosonate cytidylyltransferase (CMP-KDO synthetase)